MALANMDLKTKIGLILGRRRKREEEEEEDGGAKIKPRYGTLDFCMKTNLDHGIEWIYGTLRLCMMNSLSPNLGF